MSKAVKILMVEDLPSDAMLNEYQVKKTLTNYELKVVETREAFIDLLENWAPDLVISDYQLPSFDGLAALEIVLEKTPVTPLIIVTGSQNEDTAVECMKAGATDYVIKEHIKRLGPAIKNALKQKEIRINSMRMQKMLEESEEKFRSLFQNHAAVKLIIDPDSGNIIDANPAAARFYGWSVEELKNMNISQINIGSPEQIRNDLKAAKELDVLKFKFQHRKANGKEVDVEVFSSEVTIAGKAYLHSIVHDITEKEKLERKIAIAEQAVQFKQKFLADMSHEIRTPLTAIMGVIDLLTNSVKDEHHKEQMEILKNTGENLMEIVNQVLDYSKIQAGKLDLKFSVFDLGDLLRKSVVFYSSTCNDNVQIRLDYTAPGLPVYIKADKQRLTQVINNLVGNAVKFTHEGEIVLKASVSPLPDHSYHKSPAEYDTCIKIEVKDTGIGIDLQMQKALFKPFVQLQEVDNNIYRGTGLGLSISSQLVTLHGGEIGVDSTPGKGSTFWFTFLAKKEENLPADTSTEHGNKNKTISHLNILLAEDKIFNQKVISLMLTHMGHNVVAVCNGEEVLKFYQPGAFDLILMDIQMPVMDGITATKKLKASYNDLPPVVGLSANAFEGEKEKYLSQGMDDYITKPLRKEEFEEMTRRWF